MINGVPSKLLMEGLINVWTTRVVVFVSLKESNFCKLQNNVHFV